MVAQHNNSNQDILPHARSYREIDIKNVDLFIKDKTDLLTPEDINKIHNLTWDYIANSGAFDFYFSSLENKNKLYFKEIEKILINPRKNELHFYCFKEVLKAGCQFALSLLSFIMTSSALSLLSISTVGGGPFGFFFTITIAFPLLALAHHLGGFLGTAAYEKAQDHLNFDNQAEYQSKNAELLAATTLNNSFFSFFAVNMPPKEEQHEAKNMMQSASCY